MKYKQIFFARQSNAKKIFFKCLGKFLKLPSFRRTVEIPNLSYEPKIQFKGKRSLRQIFGNFTHRMNYVGVAYFHDPCSVNTPLFKNFYSFCGFSLIVPSFDITKVESLQFLLRFSSCIVFNMFQAYNIFIKMHTPRKVSNSSG